MCYNAPYMVGRSSCLCFLVMVIFLSAGALPVHAGSKSDQDQKLTDTGAYLEAVSKAKELSVEDQVDLWRRFLEDHPDSSFRPEIENNLKNLDNLLTETDPARKKEQQDSERYLRAVDYSKKLSLPDQIDLWEQFLDDYPKTIYRKEVVQRLEELRSKAGPSATTGGLPKPSVPITVKAEPITPRVPYKSSKTATLYAIFPGIVVPGMAHWYTRDYAIAGIMTGLRVGGLGIGIPGVLDRRTSFIVVGALLAGFSYLFDIADAPFAVERYNDALEQKASIDDGRTYAVSFSFSF